MSMVEIDGMKRLAVEIRASLEEQRLWEGFLRRFGGREFGRREDKWAAARRRAFFGLARRSRRGKGNA